MEKFPAHFMFRLTQKEIDIMVSHNAIPSKQHLGGSMPYVFTEYGVLQLANVLKSGKAIQVSIRIIEIFVEMRQLLSSHKEILQKLEQLEKKDLEHDEKILVIFKYLKQLETSKQKEKEYRSHKPVGFKQSKKK